MIENQDTSAFGADFCWADLAAVFPEEARATERAIFESLEAAGRRLAATRALALVNYEGQGDWQACAAALQLTKPGFFSLLRRWRNDRSLKSLVRGAAARREAVGKRIKNVDAATTVREIVRKHADWSRTQIVTEVLKRLPDPRPSQSSLGRIVDRTRIELEQARLGGDKGFGKRILAASSPVVLRIGRREHAFAAVAGFVVDVATGRSIGAAVRYDAIEALRAAAGAAAARAAELSQVEQPLAAAEFEVEIGGYPVEMVKEIRRVTALPIAAKVTDVDFSVRTRSRLIELIGHRVGAVNLRMRMRPEEQSAINLQNAGDLDPAEIIESRLAAELQIKTGQLDAGANAELPTLAVERKRLVEELLLLAGQSSSDASAS